MPVLFLTTRKNLAAIRILARRFSQLNIAVDHLGVGLGDPEQVETDVLALADTENLFLKFSTPILAADEPHRSFFKRVVERFGVERLMWGSDFPHTNIDGYPSMVALAKSALSFLNAAEREHVFSGTASMIWPHLKSARIAAAA